MRNILAIANKELRSYFTSPIGYATLGVFALLYGYFYIALLSYFLRQSMQIDQMGMGGGPHAMNVNQVMIRPLLQNFTILILFLLPAITMRSTWIAVSECQPQLALSSTRPAPGRRSE